MNNMRKKFVVGLSILTGVTGLLAATPSLAWGPWHPWGPRPWHRHHWHYGPGPVATALFAGLAVGAVAGYAAAPRPVYYSQPVYPACGERVVSVRYFCRDDAWGYQHCYQVRKIQHFC